MGRISEEIPKRAREKRELVAEIKKMEREHGTLTLLFGAKDEEHNQAVALARVLK